MQEEFDALLLALYNNTSFNWNKIAKLTGIKKHNFGNWTQGKSKPSKKRWPEQMLQLANVLNCDPSTTDRLFAAARHPSLDDVRQVELSKEAIKALREILKRAPDYEDSNHSKSPIFPSSELTSPSTPSKETQAVFRSFDNSISYLTDKVEGVERLNKQLLAWQLPPEEPIALEAAIARLAELPLDHVPDSAPLPDGSRMPIRNNPLFVGREEELRQLAVLLKGGKTVAVGQIAAATGMGGIGKTQLAAIFAHHYGQYFQGGVFWLNFAEPTMIPTEISQCGVSMKEVRPDFIHLDLMDQVDIVRELWQRAIPRLLIFDNCEESTFLDKWQPTSGGCRVLVTSRRRQWDAVLGVKILSISTLQRPQSLELLHKFPEQLDSLSSFTLADGPALNDIAHELGDLPLALHMAGNYLATYLNDISPKAYLEQLRTIDPLEHTSLQQGDISPTKHEQHVARTFAVSYQRLDANKRVDALALRLLAHITCFAPGELIPKELLRLTIEKEHNNDNPDFTIQFSNALRRLTELGLLQIGAKNQLLLHRLLFFFIQRHVVHKDHAEAQIVVETVLQAEAARINHSGGSPSSATWLRHLIHITDIAKQRQDESAADLCNSLGAYLHKLGELEAAREYYEQALTIRRVVLGNQHPITAITISNLGVLIKDQGELAAARPYYEQGLAIFQETLGNQHPLTASALNNFGLLLHKLGELVAARVCYEQALAIFSETPDDHNLFVAHALSNLGLLLHAQGELAAARTYYEQALAIRRVVLNEQHPDIAISLNNLGSLFYDQGELAAAGFYYEQALAIHRVVLNEQHPDIATSLNNLGKLMEKLGRRVEAISYFEQALTIHREVLGNQHPDAATILDNLGNLLYDQSQLEAAEPYFEQALTIRQEVLGNQHPDTLISLNNLGALFHTKGELEAAKPYFEKVLAIRQEVLGNQHPDTATSFNNLGMLLYEQNELSAAKPYFEKALTIRQDILGNEHTNTIDSLGTLGDLFYEQGELEAAKYYYEQIITIFQKTLGNQHPLTAMSLACVGRVFLKKNKKAKAKEHFIKALATLEETLGESHPKTVEVRNELDAMDRDILDL